jgi:C-terminal processing protease CtpA/Prc
VTIGSTQLSEGEAPPKLGIKIVGESVKNSCTDVEELPRVSALMCGAAAEMAGLCVGDFLLFVNGISTHNADTQAVRQSLVTASWPITLKIARLSS